MAKVKVLRGFLDHNRKATTAGEIVEVTERFAASLVAAHKAELVVGTAPDPTPEAASKPKAEPAATEDKPKLFARKGGRKDVS